MSQLRYQVDWTIPTYDESHNVSLLLDPEMVTLAMMSDGIKGTHAKLTICRQVRECLKVKHHIAGMVPMMFDQLSFSQLS